MKTLTAPCPPSRMSYFYSEASLVRPPSVPNLFDERTEQVGDEERVDDSSRAPRTLTPGVFKANCDLSELFFAIMTFNTTHPVTVGSNASSEKRAEFYARLTEMQDFWRPVLQTRDRFTAQLCYLG